MATKKRARTSPDSAIVDVWRRELGQLSSRNFANRLAASEVYCSQLFHLHNLDYFCYLVQYCYIDRDYMFD